MQTINTTAPLSPAQAVRRACAQAFGIDEAGLMGRSRQRRYSIARQATCYVLRQRFAHLSYPAIARLIGGRDHSTIIHAVRQTEARIERDAALAAKIRALIAMRPDGQPQDAHVRQWAARRVRAVPASAVVRGPLDEDSELAEFVDPARIYCAQCDRAVLAAEVARCGARLCGLGRRVAA